MMGRVPPETIRILLNDRVMPLITEVGKLYAGRLGRRPTMRELKRANDILVEMGACPPPDGHIRYINKSQASYGDSDNMFVIETELIAYDAELVEEHDEIDLQGVAFEVQRVDGDSNGELFPDRILLGRNGVTAEYVLTRAADGNGAIAQTGTWGRD